MVHVVLPVAGLSALLALAVAAGAFADTPPPGITRTNDPGYMLEPGNRSAAELRPYRLTLGQMSRDGLSAMRQSEFATSASAAVAGGVASIEARITSERAGAVMVQIEVYDAANTRVYFATNDGLSFAAGQSRTVRVQWDTAGARGGVYTVRIGVFQAGEGWGSLYHWNDDAARFTLR
ncbi:MAG: hypothetical protein HYX53_14420 [Chloroflexi bacterium]|nr:hypothetical protein [Chloroflexota bacterium]